MPKSKEMISDDSESGSHSEEEVKQKSKPKRQAKKKEESSDGSESEEEVKQKSKPKKVEKKKESSGSGSESDDVKSKKRPAKGKEDKGPNKKAKTQTKNAEGEQYWDLGGNKRVTVREFKGKLLIDIREFYVDSKDGKEKPGKKGIALQAANWKTLLSVIDEVDQVVKEQTP